MKYGVLSQKNPEHKADLWETLDDLYEGGFRILEKAGRYIKRQVNERDDYYKERLRHAEYINYLGMIVDSYAANLFAQEPVVRPGAEEAVDPYWEEFAKNANLKDDDFSRVMRDVFTTAILKRRAFIACDFPVVEEAAENRAEEDALGKTRGYAFELCPEELIDWAYYGVIRRQLALKGGQQVEFAYGVLKWAILRRVICERSDPEDSRDKFVEEFRVWRLGDDGRAHWATFRAPPRKHGDQPPDADLEIPPHLEGTTSFRQIPIVEVCVPPGLWLGNKLGPMALAYFRRRSALLASEDRSLFPVTVLKLGPEVSAVGSGLPPEIQQNPSRGKAAVRAAEALQAIELGYQDEYEIIEPTGTAHKLVDDQLKDFVDEFFRVAHMMASSISSTSTALGRSGSSKLQDFRAMAIVLEAYGAIMRDACLRVYDVIAEARGEDVTDWNVHGLDKFDTIDRAIILEEAATMSTVSIPSKTFNTLWKTKNALALLGNVTPDVQKAIAEEIEDGIEAEAMMADILRNPEAELGQGKTDGEDEDEPENAGAAAGGASSPGSQPPRAANGAGPAPRRGPGARRTP